MKNKTAYINKKRFREIITQINTSIRGELTMEDIEKTIKLIKKRYNINKTAYNRIVCDINFELKSNKMSNISVIFKRSDPSSPIYLTTRNFIDLKYKEVFGILAKTFITWGQEDQE